MLDIDCPNKTVCFSADRTLWVKKAYGLGTSFCDCSRSALHTGYPYCDIPTPSYYAELSTRGIELVVVSGVLLICSWDLVRLKRIRQLSWVKPTVQTTVFLVLASVCHILAIAFNLICVLPDTGFSLVVGFKICNRSTELLVFTVFATLFSFLSHANVAVVWINLTLTSKDLKVTRIDTGSQLKRALYALQLVYFIVLSVAVGLLQLNVALIATIPYAIILMVGYFSGGRALTSVLRETLAFSSGGTDLSRSNLSRSLRRVQRVTAIMSMLFLAEIVSLILSGIFLVSVTGLQYEPDFIFRPTAFFFIVDQLVMIALNVVVAAYIHVSISATVVASSQRSGSVDIPVRPLQQPNQQQVQPESNEHTAIVANVNGGA